MAVYGLEVYNASGTIILRATDRLNRYVTQNNYNIAAGQTQTFAVPGMVPDGTWTVTCSSANVSATINYGYYSVYSPFQVNDVYSLVLRI